MRLRILHESSYRYDAPAHRAIEVLRLTPRGYDGQFVVNWRIEVDRDCRLSAGTDPFGNAMHNFTVDGPFDGLTVTATGEIETQDTKGIVTGQVEPLPAAVFLRETPLTAAGPAIRAFTDEVTASSSDGLARCHALMRAINARLQFTIDATNTGTSAREAFELGHGVCQDFAHIFIAAARYLGSPARYVGGYLYMPLRKDDQGAGHAWAEALIDNVGWVGFDPANVVCPTDAYIRVAAGLDYLGAAPIRGTRYGGAGESLSVRVVVKQEGRAGR